MNKLLCFLFGHIKEKCGQKCASCSRCYKFFGEWWKTSEDQKFSFFWHIWTWIKIVALAPVALICLVIVAIKEKYD